FGLDKPVIAIAHFKAGAGVKAGHAGNDIERAGGSDFDKQSYLRTAQYLYPFNVDEVQCWCTNTRTIHPIHIKPNAGLNPIIGQSKRSALSAYIEGCVAWVGRIKLNRRDQFFQPVYIKSAGILNQ